MKIIATITLLAALGMISIGCVNTKDTTLSKASIQFDNSYFYDNDGKFLEDKAKEAYIAVMKYHSYPVYDVVKKDLWVSDYGTGKFAELGLGAYCFKNNEEASYMLMDMFLLPNQMLPEHWHLKTEKNPAKDEGWLVRHGESWVVGEGEANLPANVVIPECHMEGKATTSHAVLCKAGDWAQLNKPLARHWQFAGPEGAIINEVANVHDNAGVRHSDQAINDHFLGK